jgi:hypothetical protein
MMTWSASKRKFRHNNRDWTSRLAVLAGVSVVVFTGLILVQISPKVTFLKKANPTAIALVSEHHHKQVIG